MCLGSGTQVSSDRRSFRSFRRCSRYIIAAQWRASLRKTAAAATPQLLFEPTSFEKCTRILAALEAQAVALGQHESDSMQGVNLAELGLGVDFCTPNTLELLEMHRFAVQRNLLQRTQFNIPVPPTLSKKVLQAALDLSPILGRKALLVKLGSRGVLSVLPAQTSGDSCPVVTLHLPPDGVLAPEQLVSTTGAGDTFAGAVLAFVAQTRQARMDEETLERMVRGAQRAARLTLASKDAVAKELEQLTLEL